jgi:regulator of protease activity HflC (stomatin/prohibitin superfamily)
MFLLILGILIFCIGFVFNKNEALYKFSKPTKYAGVLIFFIGLISNCFVQVDAGQVGVKKMFGKIQNDVLESGLHFINPLYEVEKIDVKTLNYTMSGVHNEGDKTGDDAIKVLTADGLEVTIDLTVLFRVNKTEAPKLLKETGVDFQEKIVRPISRTKIRDNAVYYDAISLYSTKRDEFQARIYKSIEDEFTKRGLQLENLLVRNITLPASVKAVIEQKINAEQDAQKMQFVILKEKQEAERKRVEAQGISDYQRIINVGLTDNQLQYEQIKAMKELALSTNAKVIVMGKGNAPIILDSKN